MKKSVFDLEKKEYMNRLVEKLKTGNYSTNNTIFFDVSTFAVTEIKTGIQRVVIEWLEHLPDVLSEKYNIVPIIFVDKYGYCKYSNQSTMDVVSPGEGDVFLGIDLCAGQILGAQQQILDWQRNGCKLIACVYDLVFVLYPQVVHSPGACSLLTEWLLFICRHFDGILCISETVMNDVMYFAKVNGINNPRLSYTYYHLGCDFQGTEKSSDVPADVKEIKETNRTNFIAVSTIEPRKGYHELVSAFEDAIEAGMDSNLIIVGRKGWKAEAIEKAIISSNLFKKRLFWFNNCDDEKLSLLYDISDVYVSASYYEGFGLGVVEGALHGLPVLVRDIPVYREICKDQAVYFYDQNELFEKLLYCYNNIEAFKKNIIKPLSWKQSIEMGWDAIIQSVLEKEEGEEKQQIVPMRIHFLVHHLAFADGIGQDVLFQKKTLERKGYICDIYSAGFDEEAENYRFDIANLKCASDDLIIDHVSGLVTYEDKVASQSCRRVFLYHNITPPNLVSKKVKAFCEAGLKQVPELCKIYDFIAGDSRYNLDCLADLGINREGDVLPIPVEFHYEKIEKKEKSDKPIDFLFVGRVIPNKKFEDVINAFAYFHKNYNSNSRLTLVGKIDVDSDYTTMIKKKITESGCSSAIKMTGKVSDEKLHSIYQNSDVFLCMSEHEGFCIPLLEAMYNGLVVFAFDSTAVGETMGKAGVLFKDKDPEVVASLINDVLNDKDKKERILNEETNRVKEFSYDSVTKRLDELIEKWTSPDYIRSEDVKEANKLFFRNKLKKMLERGSVFYQFTTYNIPLSEDKGMKGIIKRFIQRVIRKLTRWMFDPLCAEQNGINNYLISLIKEILEM